MSYSKEGDFSLTCRIDGKCVPIGLTEEQHEVLQQFVNMLPGDQVVALGKYYFELKEADQ